MKNSNLLKASILIIAMTLSFYGYSQALPPPIPPPPPTGVPIDGGILALLLGLGSYGLKKVFNVDTEN